MEFNLERAFLKTVSGSTSGSETTALFKPPTPLDAGKGGWQVFIAPCKFFPMLKRLGHTGISISNYCFDRALFSTLERDQLQRHAPNHELCVLGGEKVGARALDDLQDWVVCTACANHDAQNALKWSLMSVSSDVEVVHKLHIIIESLRNSFDLILDRLAKFVAGKLRFDDGDDDRGDAYRFEVNLGVFAYTWQTCSLT